MSHWLNDYMQFGLTGYRKGEKGASSQTLRGIDATLRYRPGTFVKLERAESVGGGSGTLASQDGGFGFNGLSTMSTGTAVAQRIGHLSISRRCQKEAADALGDMHRLVIADSRRQGRSS